MKIEKVSNAQQISNFEDSNLTKKQFTGTFAQRKRKFEEELKKKAKMGEKEDKGENKTKKGFDINKEIANADITRKAVEMRIKKAESSELDK
jgi:hypothetical protein